MRVPEIATVGAVGMKRAGNGAADAAGRAGDECGSAGEIEHGVLLADGASIVRARLDCAPP